MLKIIGIDQNSQLYSEALEIWNEVWTEHTETVEEWKHSDNNFGKKFYFQRSIVELNNTCVGTLALYEPWWSFKSGKYQFDIAVLKKFRNQGIGSYCLQYIEEILSDRQGKRLNVYTKEDYLDGVNFLENRGYQMVLREPCSKLMVKDFDFSRFDKMKDSINSSGIKILSLSEVEKRDTNWQRNLYELYNKIIKDVPSNDEMTERTFEQFKKIRFESPGFDPKAFFVALDNGKYVGLSSLWKQQSKPKEFWTDLTGVVRSHRRKGIATALKVKAINHVRSIGGISIETDNEENNPMYAINLLLGFKPLPAWLTYEKIYK